MKKIFFVLLFLPFAMFAQTAGTSGLSFLKIGFGARNIAMGDAGSAVSEDVTSLFYNPAKLSVTENSEIMLMHNEWIQGISSELLGVRSEIWGLPVALGFNVTSISGIEVRTMPGEPESTFDANYFFGSLSTGFHLYEDLSIGGTIKYLYEGLYSNEATGWGFDIGLNYEAPVEGLNVSAVVRNLGSMDKLRNEETKLPVDLRIGSAYSFLVDNPELEITAAAEFQKYTSTDDIHINLGGEIVYDELLALRGGYLTGYDSKGITGGIGLKWGSLNFDYALSPFSLGLGTGHSISLSFVF